VSRIATKQRKYIGECRQVLKSLPDRLVHLVVTSPPYNVGKAAGGTTGWTSKNIWNL